jgi:hypothetical protein
VVRTARETTTNRIVTADEEGRKRAPPRCHPLAHFLHRQLDSRLVAMLDRRADEETGTPCEEDALPPWRPRPLLFAAVLLASLVVSSCAAPLPVPTATSAPRLPTATPSATRTAEPGAALATPRPLFVTPIPALAPPVRGGSPTAGPAR